MCVEKSRLNPAGTRFEREVAGQFPLHIDQPLHHVRRSAIELVGERLRRQDVCRGAGQTCCPIEPGLGGEVRIVVVPRTAPVAPHASSSVLRLEGDAPRGARRLRAVKGRGRDSEFLGEVSRPNAMLARANNIPEASEQLRTWQVPGL